MNTLELIKKERHGNGNNFLLIYLLERMRTDGIITEEQSREYAISVLYLVDIYLDNIEYELGNIEYDLINKVSKMISRVGKVPSIVGYQYIDSRRVDVLFVRIIHLLLTLKERIDDKYPYPMQLEWKIIIVEGLFSISRAFNDVLNRNLKLRETIKRKIKDFAASPKKEEREIARKYQGLF